MRTNLSLSQEPQERKTSYSTYGSFVHDIPKVEDRLNKSFNYTPTIKDLVVRYIKFSTKHLW